MVCSRFRNRSSRILSSRRRRSEPALRRKEPRRSKTLRLSGEFGPLSWLRGWVVNGADRPGLDSRLEISFSLVFLCLLLLKLRLANQHISKFFLPLVCERVVPSLSLSLPLHQPNYWLHTDLLKSLVREKRYQHLCYFETALCNFCGAEPFCSTPTSLALANVIEVFWALKVWLCYSRLRPLPT